MVLQQIGVIGMAVMGRNLALNIEEKGYSVSIYNRSKNKTDEVISDNPDANLHATYSIEEFVESLESPKKIILMVKAGNATDSTIDSLIPYLQQGDIIIDGGNTYYKETIRRNEKLSAMGINFIGTGISGGEEGARRGPSIMPGGQKEAYLLVEPILEKIAAKTKDGKPCVTYIGNDGSGHYVKMVHNGIEYGDMQLIAESYDILRRGLGLNAKEVGEIFSEWNKGVLDSFLMKISSEILSVEDPNTGEPLVDYIMDTAGNKGTGKWTSQESLDLGEPLSLITESVFARYLSAQKSQRVLANELLKSPINTIQLNENEKNKFISDLHDALYFAKIMSYAQGFSQLKTASDEYHWDLPLGKIASIWREGCIIRAAFLDNITNAFNNNSNLTNLMLDDYFKKIVLGNQTALRNIVVKAVQAGIPVPTFSAALAYFDGYKSEILPANLIQAQRDYFGAHTYNRTDKEGVYHFLWTEGKELEIK